MIEGTLFVLPYSGWAEVHAKDGVSVLWFPPHKGPKLATMNGLLVRVMCNESPLALRRVNTLGKFEDCPELTNCFACEPVRQLEPWLKESLKTTATQNNPLCWISTCHNPCEDHAAYCKDHLK